MLGNTINVVYDIALWNVVYNNAWKECGMRDCLGGMWCTILLWENCGVRYDFQAHISKYCWC